MNDRTDPANRRLLQVLGGASLTPPPIWLMRQAGRYLPEYQQVRASAGGFLNLCYSPELACEVTLQPIRRFGFDAAILFSDILVVPDALGQPVEFREGEGPILQKLEELGGLGQLHPLAVERTFERVYEAVGRIRTQLPDETALIGFCGAPWTVATYMVGGSGSADQRDARLMAYRDRDGFSALIDLLVEVSVGYLIGQIKAGVDAVQLFDSWAGNLPDDAFQRWCVEPVQRMVERLKATAPGIPVIGFPRAAGPHYESYIDQTGVDAVGCDTTLPLAWIRERLQPKAAVQGVLDPLLLLAGGRALDDRVEEILKALGDGPFVFNLGHGILPETPVDHVTRLVELVKGARS